MLLLVNLNNFQPNEKLILFLHYPFYIRNIKIPQKATCVLRMPARITHSERLYHMDNGTQFLCQFYASDDHQACIKSAAKF